MNARLAFEWLFSQLDVERLGWVLLHALWQITFVALLAETAVRMLPGKSSALRYGVLVASMALAVAAPTVTWILLAKERPLTVASQDTASPVHQARDASEVSSFPLESETPLVEMPMAAGDLSAPVPDLLPTGLVQSTAIRQPGLPWSERATLALRPWLAWIVVAWSLGVVICSARPLLGWHTLRRLRRVGVSPVPDDLLATLGRLSRQIRLPGTVRLLQSSLAQMPIVVGYFRPVILLPVSLLTGVPTAQLEAILVHELAHIRRHDFVVNLLQTVAETLFFFHPALWWISRQIRIEREHCCDDLVVQLLGNRVEYGRALVAVEQLRGTGSALALSAGGGSLLSRIRRLASGPTAESRRGVWCGGFVAILICSIGCAVLVSSTLDALVKTDAARVALPDGSTVGLLGVTSDGTDPAKWWSADGEPLVGHPLTSHRTTSQPDWGTRRRFAVRSTGAQRVAWFFPGDGKYQSSGSIGDRPDYLREEVIAPLALPSLEPTTVECGVGEGDFGPWSIIGTFGYPTPLPKTSPDLAPYYQQISNRSSVYAPKSEAGIITLSLPVYKYIADQDWAIIAKNGRRWPATRSAIRSGSSSSTFEISFSVPPDGIDHIEFRLRPFRHWVTFENVSLRKGQKTDVKVTTAPPRPEVNAISEPAPEDNASRQPASFVATILTERKRDEKGDGQRDNGPGLADKGEADSIRGLGTGIVIDRRGYIATMHHLVDSAAKIQVSLSGDQTYEARLVGSDIKRDIAVLKIDSPRPLKPASFAMSSTLKKTEPVTTIGRDQVRGFQTTKGAVTELGQHVEMNPQTTYSNLIQTDIPINPGQGGAPLMNSNGQVVGVMLALRSGTQKVSFALPVDDLLPMFKQLVEADSENDVNVVAQGATTRRPVSPSFVFPDHLNVVAVGFDREGKELVSLSTENDVAVRVWENDLTVRAWDPGGKKLKREVKLDMDKHGNIVLQGQPTLSGDRQRVIAILDGKVTIWDANTGKHLKTLAVPPEMQNSLLRGLTATPDLSLIACGRSPGFSGIGSPNADAIVWDVAAGSVLRTVSHPKALQIQSVALSADGKFLATGGQKAGLCLWDIRTGKLMYQLPNDNAGRHHPSPEVSAEGANQVLCLRFSPDGQQLALGDMLGVKMLEARTGKLLFQCDAPFRYGRSGLVFSNDGQLLARIATDKTVSIWSARTGKLLIELPTEAHDGAFSGDNRSFAVGFTDQKQGLAVWQMGGDGARGDAKPTIPSPAPKVWAELPNGQSIEFVGMTRNTASAKSGWRPGGGKMGNVPEFTVSLGGPRPGGGFPGGTPAEDENARDFLFDFRGLRDQPSIHLDLPFGKPIYAQEPIRDSQLRIRVFASLLDKENPFPDSKSNPRPHNLRVGLTDEPWGPWQQISATGQLLNNLAKNKLYQSHYSQIGFRISSGEGFPEDTLLTLRHPRHHDRLYAFEMRAFDSDGEAVRGLDWRRRVVEGTALEDDAWYLTQPLPQGKHLARFEYRLRPYRDWVTFENVSLVPGQQTDVKIRIDSMPEEKPGAGLENSDPVRDATTDPLTREPLTAWGKEVGSLQAGLGFRPGENRPYHPGETVKVVIRIRNIGKEAVEFKHIWAFFMENPPRITGPDGKIIQLPNYRTRNQESHKPRSNNLLPGKEVDLYEWNFELQPKGEFLELSSRSFLPGTGPFSLQCDRIVGPTWLNLDHPNPALDKLATGMLKLEVKDEKMPSDTPPKDPTTAWGKEVGGLQAGLSISNANAVQIGGKATVVLSLRNVSKEPITVSAWPLWLIKPKIVDGTGRQVPTTSPSSPGFDLSTTDITLKPGQTVVVATNNIFVVDAEAKGGVRHEGVADQFTIHVRQGRHRVDLKGFLEGRPTVATGTVDFEVKADKQEKPDAPATKPNNGPANEEKPLEPASKHELPVRREEQLRVLIDKVLAAHGGEDKLRKLTSFTMTFMNNAGAKHQYFIQQPRNLRLETTHQDQTIKQIFIVFPNGRKFWTQESNEEAREFIPTGAEITNEFWPDHVKFFGPRQVLRLKDPDHKVVLLDEKAKVGDRPAVGVQVTGPHYKNTMFFDKESHLLLKGVGSDILREVVFTDYKKFDGIPIARKENDGISEVLEVTDFKEGNWFDTKLFKQP